MRKSGRHPRERMRRVALSLIEPHPERTGHDKDCNEQL
jgi:hypothetical protein